MLSFTVPTYWKSDLCFKYQEPIKSRAETYARLARLRPQCGSGPSSETKTLITCINKVVWCMCAVMYPATHASLKSSPPSSPLMIILRQVAQGLREKCNSQSARLAPCWIIAACPAWSSGPEQRSPTTLWSRTTTRPIPRIWRGQRGCLGASADVSITHYQG